MFAKIKIWLIKKLYFGHLIFFWWRNWSRLYRRLYHKKYKNNKISENLGLEYVLRCMSFLTWTKDSTKELWDSCGSPHWVQYVLNEIILHKRAQPRGSLDCDDYSVWAAHALKSDFNPKLLSVCWIDKEGKMRGHVMCLCQHPALKTWFHIGNWGMSRQFVSLNQMCKNIKKTTQAKCFVGYAVLDKNLKVLKTGKGMPPRS